MSAEGSPWLASLSGRDVNEFRAAFGDAIERLNRDDRERGEGGTWSDREFHDAVWGRLPVWARRRVSRQRFDEAFAELHQPVSDAAVEAIVWFTTTEAGKRLRAEEQAEEDEQGG